MSNLAYMMWFVGTALGTIAIVTTGTLAAAGILTRRRQASQTLPPKRQRTGRGHHDSALFGNRQPGRPLQADVPLSRSTISTTGRKSARAT